MTLWILIPLVMKYSKEINNMFSMIQASAAELAKHVLAEVPQQVVKYYTMRQMLPNGPRKWNSVKITWTEESFNKPFKDVVVDVDVTSLL